MDALDFIDKIKLKITPEKIRATLVSYGLLPPDSGAAGAVAGAAVAAGRATVSDTLVLPQVERRLIVLPERPDPIPPHGGFTSRPYFVKEEVNELIEDLAQFRRMYGDQNIPYVGAVSEYIRKRAPSNNI